MRSAFVLAFAALLLAAPARANVDVDLGALDQLAPARPAKKPSSPPPRPAAKPAPPAARMEKPLPPPPAPVIVPPKETAAAPSSSPPAPAVIEMPAAPRSQSAALDQAAAQRPEPVPTLPTLERLAAPADPPPAAKAAPTQPLGTIPFAVGAADLSPQAKGALTAAAERLAADDRLRIELLAYATVEDPSQARRLSLSRALAARSFLVEHGVLTQRIDVRPLGVPGDGDADRIDLRLARH
jgi:outer membrane protein OmpA-like peptidoglycan-associated protein